MKPAGRTFPAFLALCMLAATLVAAGCGGGGDDGPDVSSACKGDVGDDAVLVQIQNLDAGATKDQIDETADYLCDQIDSIGGVEGSVDEQAGAFVVKVSGDPQQVAAAKSVLGISDLFGIYDWEPNLVAGPIPPQQALAKANSAGQQVRAITDEDGKGYVIKVKPALTIDDVESAKQGFSATNEPDVELTLTPEGQRKFSELTKEVANRKGHFAFVFGDKLISLPGLDPSAAANGVDASQGVQLTGLGGVAENEQLAKLLDLGPPPLQLFNSAAI